MTPTETQIARAERIADDIISSRATAGWTIASKAALAAIMETQEADAKVAEQFRNEPVQDGCARALIDEVAAAIRAGAQP